MYEENLMLKVAWFYYMDNMTQQHIAEYLGISRMRVVKLLSQAKADGVVQFKIKQSAKARMTVEHMLIDKYNLKDIFIVPSGQENVNDSLAKAAAQYIEAKVSPGDYINIGYGDTISKTVSHLISSIDKPISLVSIAGGVSYYTSSIILGAHKRSTSGPSPNIYVIPAPLLASTKEIADIFLNESSVSDILNMTKLASMSIVGIGAVSNSATIFKYNIVGNNDLILLKMQGAVGDILSQFYDKDGKIINTAIHERLVSTRIDMLKQSSNTIGVAGGIEKVEAIHSALKGKYLDILITDENTANLLVDFNGN